METVRLNVEIPKETRKRLHRAKIETDLHVYEIVQALIDRHLDDLIDDPPSR